MAKSSAAGLAAAGLALAGVMVLAGCGPAGPAPTPEQSTTSAGTPAPTSTAPAEPELVPGGTAAENLAYFDKVNSAFLSTNGKGTSQLIIDNLVAAGFSKQDMEVTRDRTAIDLETESIIFSVRIKGECLVGDLQVSSYKSMVAPLLGTGSCLVGATLPIDW